MEQAEVKEIKRPKAGSYPTFTSRRGRSTILFQKPLHGKDKEFDTRVALSEQVSITLQRGVEFDAYKVCLGDKDGNGATPYFKNLVKNGYLKNGKHVAFEPSSLQKFLEEQVQSPTNRIILWKDRPRSAIEISLEKQLNAKDEIIEAEKAENARLMALLAKNKA